MGLQAVTTSGLEIWRYHARRAESAARNATNCRLLLANMCQCKLERSELCRDLADDATRYALSSQAHARIAMTFRDGFQPITRRAA